VCAIEADLIYASENLAVLPSKSNKRSCIGTLGKAYLSRQTAKAATTLETVITAGNYSLVEIIIRF
jgi:hypothetical protein